MMTAKTPKSPKAKPARLIVSDKLTLMDTQALFQKAILDGHGQIYDLILDNSRTTRETLFGVYQHAYVGRLVEILASDYEFLKAHLGEHAFDALARAYVAAHPSRSQNARWFGAALPEFLRTHDAYASNLELADLAKLEKALSDAFDAADAPSVTMADLTKYQLEDWARLTFAPHPSVALLAMRTNAFAIWRAIKAELTPPAAAQVESHVIAWRQNATPMVREIGNEEVMLWREACRGARFDALCEMAATFDDADTAAVRAAGYLQNWLVGEMLTSAQLAPQPAARRRGKLQVQ